MAYQSPDQLTGTMKTHAQPVWTRNSICELNL